MEELEEATTSSDGAYTFTTSLDEPSMRYRVVAPAKGELEKYVTAPVTVSSVEDAVTLSIVRAGRSGTALGEAKFRKPGREFELQWLDGSKWKAIDSAQEDQHGRTKIAFDIKGSRFYRLVGEVIKGTKGATSPAVRFTMGPRKLSNNVIYVTVDGGKNPIVKGADYKANAVLVTDGKPSKPLRVDEFEVRGNSSAPKVKHPYKMKFKKPRRPFNLPEDKTWILLANYGDRSLVRTAMGYGIGAGLDGLAWTPRSTFTELFVNGEYVGSYQISESIKIDKNRINIDKKKGVVVEIDPHFKEDDVPGFFGDHKIPYAFKDPDERKKGKDVEEGITDDKVAGIKSRVMALEEVLYGDDFQRSRERLDQVPRPRLGGRLLPRQGVHQGERRRLLSQQLLLHRRLLLGILRSSWDRCGTSTGAPGPSRMTPNRAPRSPARRVVAARQRLAEPQHRQDPLVRPDDEGPGVPRRPREAVGREARVLQGHGRPRRGA